MKVSGLVMIRDEAGFFLEESLKSFLELCDEVIVINDNPPGEDRDLKVIEGINSSKIKVLTFECSNENNTSYGYLKNKGIDACSGDWIFSFDADEVLHEASVPFIKDCLERTSHDCFDIQGEHYYWFLDHVDAVPEKHLWIARLFKNDGKIKYPSGKAHGLPSGAKSRGIIAGLVLHHYGYCKNLIFDLARYEQNTAILEIHTKDYLRKWMLSRMTGEVPLRKVGLSQHPRLIQERFRVNEWA